MSEVVSNILDPIHDTLPPEVWDNPEADKPTLKESHRKWIESIVTQKLKDAGYSHVEHWLNLILTGSLTTYQYGPESDCDVSLFVDTEVFPEWSRAEMIGVMVSHVDGTLLPGTHYPMQCFVVAQDIRPQDLYRPGLRSGYDLQADKWIQPPERDRALDVQAERYGMFAYALEQADKMEKLLKYEPDKAVEMWHAIHKKRQRDQRAGKGDFALSNIIYKFLANRGLFKDISEASGEYIAKSASLMPHPEELELARQQLGLQHPVRFMPTFKDIRGGYGGINRDPMTGQPSHLIYFNPNQQPGARNWAAWHELAHAQQTEKTQFMPTNQQTAEQYAANPREHEADQLAAQYADRDLWRTARTSIEHRKVAKFVYDPTTNRLVFGHMAAEEGAVESHHDLMKQAGIKPEDGPLFGQITSNGYVETFGRPMITGFGQPPMNQYEADWRLKQAIQQAVPDAKFTGNQSDVENPHWRDTWTEPSIEYLGERPTFDNATDQPTPAEGVWQF
jgi:hypothetical protein